jgi:hypothetical protein
LAEEVGGGWGEGVAEFVEEGAAGAVAAAGADVVELVDGGEVVTDGFEGEVKFLGDLVAGEAGEQEGLDLEAALVGAFDLIEGRGSAAEFGDEGVAVGDIFLLAEDVDVAIDGVEVHLEVAGDAADGPAVEQAAQDLLAARGEAGEMADAGDFAAGFVPGGARDLAAVEKAGGEVGDELVPTVGMGGGEMLDVVTGAAGEGGRGLGRFVGVGSECGHQGGIEGEEVAEIADGEGTEDGADEFIAGGAEPAPAAEEEVVFGEGDGGSARDRGRGTRDKRILSLKILRRTGNGRAPHPALSPEYRGEGRRRRFGGEGRKRRFRGEGRSRMRECGGEGRRARAWYTALPVEDGAADEGLLEVVGDLVGEELPERAADGVGGGVESAGAGVEWAAAVEDGDVAAFAAEMGDVAFGELAGAAGFVEAGAG